MLINKQAEGAVSYNEENSAISIPDIYEFLKSCEEKNYTMENVGSILIEASEHLNDTIEKSILSELSYMLQEMFIEI